MTVRRMFFSTATENWIYCWRGIEDRRDKALICENTALLCNNCNCFCTFFYFVEV